MPKDVPLFPRRAGFTLVELLVVIAVVSLLAAILFPTFGRARENARRSSCASNLRQIGLAALQYAQDFDEVMPPYSYTGAEGYGGGDGARWADLLAPYFKNSQILSCPNAAQPVKTRAGGAFFDVSTYSYGFVTPSTAQPVGIAGRPLSAIEESATTLMFVEDGRLESGGTSETQGRLLAVVGEPLSALASRLNGFRHTGCGESDFGAYAFNATYADGHVKWLRLSQTWDGGKMTQWTILAD